MDTPTATYDPAPLNRTAPASFAKLEHLRDAARRARKKLACVQSADQHIALLVQSKSALIKECLKLEMAADFIADLILEDVQVLAINRRKLIGAIQRCRLMLADGSALRKLGRPRKNQDAGPQPADPDAATAAAASSAHSAIAAAKSASTAAASAAKQAAKPEKSSAAPTPRDSPEREQRMRRKAPVWAMHYEGDRKYGHVVARRAGESDTDYFLRMWRTAPPWSHEMLRFADQLTETQWVEKCWNLKSPEERAAHQASLPSTAR